MANKEIHELVAAAGNLLDTDVLAGVTATNPAKKYTGLETRAVEKAAREAQDNVIEAGVGLNTDGTYNTPTGTNYINASTDVMVALDMLDTQIKSVVTVNVSEERAAREAQDNVIEAGVGLNTDGTYNTPTGTNYIDASTDVMDALDMLDTQIESAVTVDVFEAKGYLSSAEVLQLGTYKEILKAPMANKVLDVIDVVVYFDVGTRLVVGVQTLNLTYNGGSTISSIANGQVESVNSIWVKPTAGDGIEMSENTSVGFMLSAATNPDAGGDVILRFKILYRVVDKTELTTPYPL